MAISAIAPGVAVLFAFRNLFAVPTDSQQRVAALTEILQDLLRLLDY